MRALAPPPLFGEGVDVCDDCISITADIRMDSVARALFEPSRLRATCPCKVCNIMTYKQVRIPKLTRIILLCIIYIHAMHIVSLSLHKIWRIVRLWYQCCSHNTARFVYTDDSLSTVLGKITRSGWTQHERKFIFNEWIRFNFYNFFESLRHRLFIYYLYYILHSLRKKTLY